MSVDLLTASADTTADPQTDLDLGLVRIAGMDLAVPLEALREVVPCPQELTALPVPAPELLGGMNLRGLALPVLDIGAMLDRPSGGDADRSVWTDRTIVVIAHGGHVVGLLTDGVRGMVKVPWAKTTPVDVVGDSLLISRVFLHPESDVPVAVLSAAALLGRAGIPLVPDVGRSLDAGHRSAGSAAVTTLVTVRCADHRLALDVDSLHTTIPLGRPEPSLLEGPVCRGVVSFGGRRVPVVDPLALLGLGRMDPEDVSIGIVLALGAGYVVLAASKIVDLLPLADGEPMTLSSSLAGGSDLVRGVVADGGGTLVLDGPTLCTDETLRSMAAVNTVEGSGPERGAALGSAGFDLGSVASSGAAPDLHLVYSVGSDVTTRLDQIQEVVPYQGALVTTTTHRDGPKVLLHRHEAIPVLDLRALLGLDRSADVDDTFPILLLVRSERGSIAFLVSALRSIEPLSWRETGQEAPGPMTQAVPGLSGTPLIRVGEDPRLLPEIHLADLAAAALSAAP